MKIVIVDKQDLARAQLFTWLAEEDCRGIWRIYTKYDGQHILLDQMILDCNVQQPIDHLDNDAFNCCCKNLEGVSMEELVGRRIRRTTGVTVEISERDPF